MHTSCCKTNDDGPRAIVATGITPSTTLPPRSSLGLARGVIEWAIPIIILAVIPKCPACVAGYVLLFTGIGLSWNTAFGLRWSLILASLAAIIFLLVRTSLRWSAGAVKLGSR